MKKVHVITILITLSALSFLPANAAGVLHAEAPIAALARAAALARTKNASHHSGESLLPAELPAASEIEDKKAAASDFNSTIRLRKTGPHAYCIVDTPAHKRRTLENHRTAAVVQEDVYTKKEQEPSSAAAASSLWGPDRLPTSKKRPSICLNPGCAKKEFSGPLTCSRHEAHDPICSAAIAKLIDYTTLTCLACGKNGFTKKDHLRNHYAETCRPKGLRRVTAARPVPSNSLQTPHEENTHRITRPKKIAPPLPLITFTCLNTSCTKNIYNTFELYKHELMHEPCKSSIAQVADLTNFTCRACNDRQFSTKKNLRKHCKIKHSQEIAAAAKAGRF